MEEQPKASGELALDELAAKPSRASEAVDLLPEEVAPPIGRHFTFGAHLEPVLRRACADRLSAVSWFRTDWQRGGAMTGYATFTADDGLEHPVVVKLPVRPVERQWLLRLQEAGGLVPRIHAHQDTLNGYDMAWLVMERLPHGPLGSAWDGREFDLLVEAVVRFYQAAEPYPVTSAPPVRDWEAVYQRSRDHVQTSGIAQPQRWRNALKHARKKLKHWLGDWEQRPIISWCHGDLHLANAMTRHPAPLGPAVLLDFAETRPGHWVEDAVYFEHLYWARRDRLGGRKLGSMIAHQRKACGLSVDPDWPHWARIKRALLAMSTPAQLEHDGDPQHVHAALEVLESCL